MGSLMPAMAGVAERLVPCRVAAMPLARSVVVAGECPPSRGRRGGFRRQALGLGRNPKISKLHPLCLQSKRPEVW
jgi:hypothetical protein